MTYEYSKYCTTKEHLKDTIDIYGVAIIPNVVNLEECNNLYSKMWGFFEHISSDWEIPLDKNNISTYKHFISFTFNVNTILFYRTLPSLLGC